MSKTLLFISEIRKDSAAECQSFLLSWQPHEVVIIQRRLRASQSRTCAASRGGWPWRQQMKCKLSSGSTISSQSLWYEDASLELRGMAMLCFSHMDLGFINPSLIHRFRNSGIRCRSGCSRDTLLLSSAWLSTHVQCVFLNLTSTLLFEKIYVYEGKESKSENDLIRRKYALRDRHIPKEKKTLYRGPGLRESYAGYFSQGLWMSSCAIKGQLNGIKSKMKTIKRIVR